MPEKFIHTPTDPFTALRREAEKAMNSDPGLAKIYSARERAELLQEVQVQHIELQMQNEQLQLYNDELETERKKFAGLYDLAPVGYFILDINGIITDVNNTGCSMLDQPKSSITGKNFRNFIVNDNSEPFTGFFEAIQIFDNKQSCQLTMIRPGSKFYAQVEGVVPAFDNPESICCYIAVIDITEQKNAEIKQEIRVLSATITAQENERKSISEALHNSVGQLLYGIKLKIDHEGITEMNYKNIRYLIDQAIQETRNISFELAPAILKDFGIPVTLNEMAIRLCNSNLAIQVNTDLKERLDLALEISIFRIIQELVNNSIKHASASKITVAVKNGPTILIEVADNGKGFDDEKARKSLHGSGLAAIRSRFSLYNGEMHIETKRGAGSKIQIILMKPET